MNHSYEAPELRVLGSVEDLTKDGMIIKVGSESDAFLSLVPPDITGSNVSFKPGPTP